MIKWTYLLVVLIVYGKCEVAGQFKYSECENTICIGLPENCLTTLNCLAVGKVASINSSAFEFDVRTIPDASQTTAPAYVAIVLSLDPLMEDDSIVECVFSNNENEVFVSYTRQGLRGADRLEHNDEIKVTHRSYTDGVLHCIFERQTITNNQTFDVNQLSYRLLVDRGNEVDVNLLNRQRNRITSSESLIRPEIKQELNDDIDYDGCGKTHSCLGMPSGCIDEKNCHTAVAITYTSPTYTFQIMTNLGTTYVAVALSEDRWMADDSVIECVREDNIVNMYTSYTRVDYTGTDRHLADRLATLLNSSYVNGKIHCYVERIENITINGHEFDIDNQAFHIMLIYGDDATTTQILEHKDREVSSRAIFLQDPANLAGADKPLLIKLHGCFMIVAWMGTAAVGLVLARYFKSEWSDKKMFGKDFWFVGHMACMVITWILTLAAFAIIFIHVGGWTKIGNTHGILGIIVTGLCFFQPILAAFRPSPTHKRRYLFNIGHYFIGRITFLLAIVTICYAIFITSAEIPIWFIAIMMSFVIVFWGNHVLLGTMIYLTGGKRGIFTFLRSLLGPAIRVDYKKGEYSAWYIRKKVTVLFIYLLAISGFVIAGILVVWLARR